MGNTLGDTLRENNSEQLLHESSGENHVAQQVIIERMLAENCHNREREFLQSLNPPITDGEDEPTIWAWPPAVAGVKDQTEYMKGEFGLLHCGIDKEKPYWWIRKLDGTPVGMIKVNRVLSTEGLRQEGHIAISIAEPYRNQGYGTAALRAAKEALYLPDCLCVVDETNQQMCHIVECCGGKYWDTIKTQRYTYRPSTPRNGHTIYALRKHPGEFRHFRRYWL